MRYWISLELAALSLRLSFPFADAGFGNLNVEPVKNRIPFTPVITSTKVALTSTLYYICNT